MAYTEVLLISEATLKNYSVINDNVSYSLVKPIVKAIQDTRLTRLLGLNMYKDIIGQVSSETIDADTIFLLDNYITEILIWGTLCELNVFLNTKFKNTGIVQPTVQNSKILSLSEGDYNSTSYRYYEEYYSYSMQDYICENHSKYPLYCPQGNDNINCPITF